MAFVVQKIWPGMLKFGDVKLLGQDPLIETIVLLGKIGLVWLDWC